jgi:hypothetical protein
MKKIIAILFCCSIVCLCCSTLKTVPKQSSNYNIISDDCNIIPYKSNYFLSGYYFDHNYSSYNNSFNICLSDSICFYKTPKSDKYICIPSTLNIYDLSRDYSFFNDCENVSEVPEDFDPKIITKINNYKHSNLYNGQYFPFHIEKKNISYNYSNFKNNSQISLSYYIVFHENRKFPTFTGIPAFDVASDLVEIARKQIEDSLLFSDFIYIESYPKNFVVTEVEDSRYYSLNPIWHSDIRWDFIEKENMNCLIIYFNDIKSNPKNTNPILNLKVNGIYKK